MNKKNYILELIIEDAIKETILKISNDFLILNENTDDVGVYQWLDNLSNGFLDNVIVPLGTISPANMLPNYHATKGNFLGLTSAIVSWVSTLLPVGSVKSVFTFAQGFAMTLASYEFYMAAKQAGPDEKLGFKVIAVVLGVLGLGLVGFSLAAFMSGLGTAVPDPEVPETTFIITLSEVFEALSDIGESSFTAQKGVDAFNSPTISSGNSFQLTLESDGSVVLQQIESGSWKNVDNIDDSIRNNKEFKERSEAVKDEILSNLNLDEQKVREMLIKAEEVQEAIQMVNDSLASKLNLDEKTIKKMRESYLRRGTKDARTAVSGGDSYTELTETGKKLLAEINQNLSGRFEITEAQLIKLIDAIDASDSSTYRNALIQLTTELQNFRSVSDDIDVLEQKLINSSIGITSDDDVLTKLLKLGRSKAIGAFDNVFDTNIGGADEGIKPMTGRGQKLNFKYLRRAFYVAGEGIDEQIRAQKPKIPVSVSIESTNPFYKLFSKTKGPGGGDRVVLDLGFEVQIIDGEPAGLFLGHVRSTTESGLDNVTVGGQSIPVEQAEATAKKLWDKMKGGLKETAINNPDAVIPDVSKRCGTRCTFQPIEEFDAANVSRGNAGDKTQAGMNLANSVIREYNEIVRGLFESYLKRLVNDTEYGVLLNGNNYEQTRAVYAELTTPEKSARARVNQYMGNNTYTRLQWWKNFVDSVVTGLYIVNMGVELGQAQGILPQTLFGTDANGNMVVFDYERTETVFQANDAVGQEGDRLTIDMANLEKAKEQTNIYKAILIELEEDDEEESE